MFNSIISSPISVAAFLICVLTAIVLGALTAIIFTRRGFHTASFSVALALLPAVVSVVIMLVNGNIGAGLAVAGTFALVRFRSAPGTAKEITSLFLAVALGLACGMGYVVMAALFFAMMAVALILLETLHFGEDHAHRQLKITIPEDLDYDGVFDEIFAEFTLSHELLRVQTTNMGTLYELTYDVVLKDSAAVKRFIDALRCRNGNLNIVCGRHSDKDMI